MACQGTEISDAQAEDNQVGREPKVEGPILQSQSPPPPTPSSLPTRGNRDRDEPRGRDVLAKEAQNKNSWQATARSGRDGGRVLQEEGWVGL